VDDPVGRSVSYGNRTARCKTDLDLTVSVLCHAGPAPGAAAPSLRALGGVEDDVHRGSGGSPPSRFFLSSDNVHTGTIPTELAGLSRLLLSGPIPSSVGDWQAPTALHIGSSNLLTGSIPTVVGRLRCLEDLELEANRLTGYASPPSSGN
jgi:hypothetical protein